MKEPRIALLAAFALLGAFHVFESEMAHEPAKAIDFSMDDGALAQLAQGAPGQLMSQVTGGQTQAGGPPAK